MKSPTGRALIVSCQNGSSPCVALTNKMSMPRERVLKIAWANIPRRTGFSASGLRIWIRSRTKTSVNASAQNLLDVLAQEAATVERLTAHLHEELAADRHRSASMIDAGVIDADEVHLGGGADHLVVADPLGGVDIERPA